MRNFLLLFAFTFPLVGVADTPPPGTVKAKTWSGDGNTAVTVTGSALDVNVTNASGLTTVNQGNAGVQSWLAEITSSALPANACQETGGNLAAILSKLNSSIAVTGTFFQATQPVSGTFWQATQPVSGTVTANAGTGTFAVSAASLPLPSGAATSDKQPALGTAGTPSSDVITVQGKSGMTALVVDGSGVTQPVSGTFWQATQPVSAASLPLPSGASTAAKQPALGTAGTPSSDVITVQGKTSMTPLLVDGSGATQPVSGTVTANAGTGTFTVDGSGHTQPVSGTFWQATQPVSGTVTANAGSGTFAVSGTVTANAGSGTFTVDGSGHTQPVSGTVTANIGTSGSLALDASVTGLQVTQGSTTSGQSGGLTQGAVTTGAPTYTTGKTDPLSLTTAGALRIDGSATTQPVSGTFWQTTQPVSLATAPVLVAGSAIIGKVGIDQTTPGTTNGVQVNAALPAGTNVIGKVSIDQTTPGTTNLVALAANQSVNVAQINGVTPLMGNGTTGTGSQRVTIASDNTAFTVNAQAKTPTALTVKQAAISVGTSAVRLTNDGSAPASTRVLLVAQLLSTSTANCYFGSSGVTTTSTTRGVQMFAGQTISFTSDAGDYYAICDASSQTIFVTEQE